MAQVKVINYGTYQANSSKYATFFNSFNCPLMTVTTASSNKCIVSFPDTFKVTFDLEPASAQSSSYQSILTEYNGSSTKYSGECVISRGLNILCACSDNFVYIDHWDGWGNHFEILYSKTAGCRFYSWLDNSNVITSMTLHEIESGLNYTLGSRLNFSNDSGIISITDAALFRSGIRSINDSNFLCCTPVTKGVKVLVGDDVYYSLNTNILVPYEEVENG